MIFKVFTVFDSKAEAYLPPFILPHDDMAKRIFSDCCNKDDHQFGAHPADYTLFRLGCWSDKTSGFDLENAPVNLGVGVEFVKGAVVESQLPLEIVS